MTTKAGAKSEIDVLLKAARANGFKTVPGRGHRKFVDRHGKTVVDDNGPVIISSSPSDHRWREMTVKRMMGAKILKVDPFASHEKVKDRDAGGERNGKGDVQLRKERNESLAAGEQKIQRTTELRNRLGPLLANAGDVRPGDLARVASFVNGKWELDSAMTTSGHFLAGKALHPGEIERMMPLVERLEKAPSARAEWFMLLRETLGLDQPTLLGGREWPYSVKLIPLDKVFAHVVEDGGYQRPAEERFVRDLTLRFDERLVGTIDVSQREDGRFAVIDGQQRSEAMRRAGKTGCYASVYENLTLAEEASLFFHKNRDRKSVHPYYEFMARYAADDPMTKAIKKIVEAEGFLVHIAGGAGKIQGRERHVTAIRAIEEVYGYETTVREECLSPTLATIHRNWFGRKDSLSVNMIRGLGRIFRMWGDKEIQWGHWEEQLQAMGPSLIIGKAEDLRTGRYGNQTKGIGVSLTLVEIHNRGLPRGQRLDATLVQSWREPPRASWRQKGNTA
jgi:hypothetical protein